MKISKLIIKYVQRINRVKYADFFTFGGFKKDGSRTFFVIPCIRVAFNNYPASFSLIFGFGILFWEFLFTVEIWK